MLSRPGPSRGAEPGVEVIGGGTTNSALLTPGYLLALLRELSHVPRGLTEIAQAKQVQKTSQTSIGPPL